MQRAVLTRKHSKALREFRDGVCRRYMAKQSLISANLNLYAT